MWLKSTEGTTFVQTLPRGRNHLVVPNECIGLPKEGLSPYRRTFANFADGHDITIDDRWPGPHGARALSQPWSGSVTFHVGGDGELPFWEDGATIAFSNSPPPFSASHHMRLQAEAARDRSLTTECKKALDLSFHTPHTSNQKHQPSPALLPHAQQCKSKSSGPTSSSQGTLRIPGLHVMIIVLSSLSCLMTRLKMRVRNLTMS